MKSKLPLLFGATLLAFAVAACEGPAGPQGPAGTQGETGATGPAGPQGPAGESAANICSDCHSSDATIVAIEQQFELSPHGFGNFTIQARSSCWGCHTSQGFVARFTGEEPDFTLGVASLNCRTCHQIHTDFEEADFALTTTDPVKLMVGSAEGDSIVNFGGDVNSGSNLCASCHQARTEDAWASWQAPLSQMFELGEHYDTHHGPQGNVFAAELPAEFEFGDITTGVFGPHEEVACVGCHMGLNVEGVTPMPTPDGELSHTFRPSEDVCGTCHDPDFDYGGIRTQTMETLQALGECLEAEGVITDFDWANHSFDPVFDDEATPAVNEGLHPEPYVAAFLAFATMLEDGSWGVHQPRYANEIVVNALAFMETNSALCPVVVP